jgi:hypothetical protein
VKLQNLSRGPVAGSKKTTLKALLSNMRFWNELTSVSELTRNADIKLNTRVLNLLRIDGHL